MNTRFIWGIIALQGTIYFKISQVRSICFCLNFSVRLKYKKLSFAKMLEGRSFLLLRFIIDLLNNIWLFSIVSPSIKYW